MANFKHFVHIKAIGKLRLLPTKDKHEFNSFFDRSKINYDKKKCRCKHLQENKIKFDFRENVFREGIFLLS